MTHICVGKLTIIGSYNGLSPGRRQAIIWTNAGVLFIWPLVTNFNEIPTEIYIFSFKKMHLKMSSGKWRPFCLGLNVWSRWLPLPGSPWVAQSGNHPLACMTHVFFVRGWDDIWRETSNSNNWCVLLYTRVRSLNNGVRCTRVRSWNNGMRSMTCYILLHD